MSGASESKLYKVFQTMASVLGAGLVVVGLVNQDSKLMGYGAVILVHGLVATLMIWIDGRRSLKSS